MKTQLVHDLTDASFGVCALYLRGISSPIRYLMFCFPLVVTLVRACTGIGFQGIGECCFLVIWICGGASEQWQRLGG